MAFELEELLESPELVLYQQKIEARLRGERQRREQFIEKLSPAVKAEFINGTAVFHSPTMLKHNLARMNLSRLMAAYVAAHKLGMVCDEKLLISFSRNDYEPDIVFFNADQAASLKPDQIRFPAPNLIVEVLSPSTEANDRGVKFRDYAAHGVAEYWIIDPESSLVEQYQNVDSQYALRLKSGSGDISSFVINSFKIPVRSIFDAELNLVVLRQMAAAKMM